MIRRFVSFFASRAPLTILLWVALLAFGIVSYFSLLPREGFPSVDAPIALASGSWFVDDTDAVDAEVVQPLTEQLRVTPGIASTASVARENSFTLITDLDDTMSSAEGALAIEQAIAATQLPPNATVAAIPLDVAKFLEEYDLLVGVAGPAGAGAAELEAAAATVVPALNARGEILRAEVVNLIDEGVNPATGQTVIQEAGFNQLTTDSAGTLTIRPSVAVGVVAADGVDSLGIRDITDQALAEVRADSLLPAGFNAEVAIDQATQIRQQISSLQTNVITGIIAVALVALLLISWRASIITALFIITVMATTFGVLYLIGISLNTISLFGVIIALGLFVDDSIVITEAIDQFREGAVDPEQNQRTRSLAIIRHAIDRVGAASVSGTLTTVLVFAPMLAISGILGDFIRILPISVIVALVVSLLLSLVFIPLAARFLVLSAPVSRSPIARLSGRLARAVGALPGIRGGRGVVVGLLGVLLSVAMTAVGLFVFAPKVGFNIFPPQKDSQFVQLSLTYEPGTTIEQAREISTAINQAALTELGDDVEQIYTYSGNVRSSFSQYRLSEIGGRTVAPVLVDDVLQPLAESTLSSLAADGLSARAVFTMLSAGPPELLFPFQMQLFDEDPDTLAVAAGEITDQLRGAAIARPNGTTFAVVETDIGLTNAIARDDGRRYVEVRARFDADDVTTTTAETQAFIERTFDEAELERLGLAPDALGFDFGLESDNQESFASMPRAFMMALALMLVLLIVQFRSAVQWFLVFLAIPFSFFGVFGGLLLTDNQISFFVMLGLLGLIGIAVNNTILLTDFANQERRAGADRKDAITEAMRRRFRPLIATSLTTVAGVLPLALSDPFWEALGFTIIFGLLSSTFLVLASFPYYYLAIEWMRDKTRGLFRRNRAAAALDVTA